MVNVPADCPSSVTIPCSHVPAVRPLVSSRPTQRTASAFHVSERAQVAGVVDPQARSQSPALPLDWATPSREIETFTGSVLPGLTVTWPLEEIGGANRVASVTRLTLTSNPAPAEFWLASVAVHVTCVVPTANVDPEAGQHETLGDGSTTSVAVGG